MEDLNIDDLTIRGIANSQGLVTIGDICTGQAVARIDKEDAKQIISHLAELFEIGEAPTEVKPPDGDIITRIHACEVEKKILDSIVLEIFKSHYRETSGGDEFEGVGIEGFVVSPHFVAVMMDVADTSIPDNCRRWTIPKEYFVTHQANLQKEKALAREAITKELEDVVRDLEEVKAKLELRYEENLKERGIVL